MEKLKKLFHHEKKELVIIHPHLEPLKPSVVSFNGKKKRFSLNLLQQPKSQQQEQRKRLAKSASFLQLAQLLKQPTSGNQALKSSQSMCFQDDTCSSATTVVNEDVILHTAAVVSYPITTSYHEHPHK